VFVGGTLLHITWLFSQVDRAISLQGDVPFILTRGSGWLYL